MAVNTITFGGVNSSSYGIYISGEGVFNAPVRDAEMISIPGRNGSFLLDNGRYDNIEVTYPAFNTATDKATFIANIDAFRNAIASQKGYQRLEDTFHADEYRMASFIGGLEINPILYNDHTSQFEIVFNCKPQRFLKSGETATSKANNSTISNSTLFDAHPLLEFTSNGSDGTINLGSQQIKVLNALVGITDLDLTWISPVVAGYALTDVVTINNTGVYESGDLMTFKGASANFRFLLSNPAYEKYTARASNPNGLQAITNKQSPYITTTISATDSTFTAGTSSTVSKTVDIDIYNATDQKVETKTITLELVYNGSSTITARWIVPTFTTLNKSYFHSTASYTGTVDSTKNTLTGTIYIDLDIGEAYKIDGGNTVSLNNFVNLGADLPVLPPGTTTISYTNVSNFKVTPRWWKI